MIKIENKAHCYGCGACASKCPTKSIEMKEDADGFWYPQVDLETCTDCSICDRICKDGFSNCRDEAAPSAYYAFHRQEEVRGKSSSGGFFTALASWILKNGGCVVGAAFTENFQVKHIIVENENELERLQGSKYIESIVEPEVYCRVKTEVENNKYVLFSGTPCQIVGILSFLGRDYERLITMDLVCHGTPSYKLQKKYLNELEMQYRAKMNCFSYRDKETEGWHKFHIKAGFENGRYYSEWFNTSAWGRIFNNCYFLRPSCYECKYKGIYRDSDFTVGDLWGSENTEVVSSLDDNRGINLLLVHTEKGRTLLKKLKDITYGNVLLQSAIPYNWGLMESAELPIYAKRAKADLESQTLSWIADKYCNEKLLTKIKRKIYRKYKKLRNRNENFASK